ncbi:hypothetical protein LXA43DRAFT_670403 [Ganoderma leucocontextum]|nr:hypothetical protein LXA43DRAFT_670403 [Ganoderma leucocontextum]
MRKRCIEGYAAAAAFLVVARATATITVDDGDPGIQYHGTWVHNLINDPKDLNYGGSVTFTNVSGSTATYKFTGESESGRAPHGEIEHTRTGTTAGTAIAVFGAFEVAGTFSMHSTYSIDGGPATDFIPASTTVRAAYRQKFFQSGTLSDGEHTLVIANVGRELWLDYLLITPPPQSTTAITSALSQNVQAPSASTTQAPPPTTGPATTSSSSAGQSVTTQPGSGPSSQTQTTHSLSNTNDATLTSTDAAGPPPPAPSSPSQSQTPVLASGIASPTSTPARAHSSRLAAGAIAGLAVAALVVVVVIVLVGLVGWRSRRRKQAHRRDHDLTPYNAGLTALASEPSEKQEQDLAHDGNSNSRGSAATSLLSLSPPVPAYTQAPAETRASGSSGPGERSVPHEIQTTDLDGMRMGRDRRTGFEPLGSPSSASPLLARRPHGGRQQQKDSPITSSAGLSRYTSPLDERRRSVDGGVRIAGGPPGNLGQEDALGDGDDDVRSGLSTLPPSYRLYTAV